MESGKAIYQTRTFWANVVTTGLTIGAAFGLDLDITVEQQTTIVGVVYMVVNTFMRYITKTPVKKISIIK